MYSFVFKVSLSVDTTKMTVKELEENILKKALNMVAPDARLDDGSGSIIISSEEGETEHNNSKTLQVSSVGFCFIIKIF